MAPSRVQDMAEDMMVQRFNWTLSGPIDVAEQQGVRIIIDGHHRTAAAIEASVKEVPIRTHTVSEEAWSGLFAEVLEAGGMR